MMNFNEDVTENVQEPIKHSFCQSLRRDTHWKCLVLSLLIYGCMAAIIWCRFTVLSRKILDDHVLYVQTEQTGPCSDGYVYIPIAFIALLYLVYLVECWHCQTRIELQCKVDAGTVYDNIQKLREAIPILWWKSVCYHYVRRSKHVTRYRNGDAYTSTQIYYERINSHTASSCFNFIGCGMKDISNQLTRLENFPATKIKFSKGYSFAANDAEQEFEQQKGQFFHSYHRMDDHMETREGFDLMNIDFNKFVIALADPDYLPWYVSQAVFWISAVLLMSWPLRILIDYKTAFVHFHVDKLFGINYLDPQCSSGQMTRANTFGSGEMEFDIQRGDYEMVPSYSEALLMDCPDKQDTYGTLTCPNGNMIKASTSSLQFKSNTYADESLHPNVPVNGYIPLPGEIRVVLPWNNSVPLTESTSFKKKFTKQPECGQHSCTSFIQPVSKDVTVQSINRPVEYSQSYSRSIPYSPSDPESVSRQTSMSLLDFKSCGALNESTGASCSMNQSGAKQTGSSQIDYSTNAQVGFCSQTNTRTALDGNAVYHQEAAHADTMSFLSDQPPPYELVIAMRRAAASAAGILPVPLFRNSSKDTYGSVRSLCIPHREQTSCDGNQPDPVNGLLETAL